MGFLNKLSEAFRKNNNSNFSDEKENENETKTEIPTKETYPIMDFPEGEIVPFSDEILDTTSEVSIEKLNHNLKILIQEAKEKGKIDKFFLIREDDFFPHNWEWEVFSKNTYLDTINFNLSLELRYAYALEQNGINPYNIINDISIPNNITREKELEALSQIDNKLGTVLLPTHFRSTKHFTINTPLEVTGSYNWVDMNRDYIIIDNINAFLNSHYGYSVSYRDAYLDVSHEPLPISQQAVVLIDDEKYERIMSDEKIAKKLEQRRVIRYKGNTETAIDMILTEMGALPSQVSHMYLEYDKEITDILKSSIENLAKENDLFFDKGHYGIDGHFSSYYDQKNEDYEISINEFWDFLKQEFPEQEQLFSMNALKDDRSLAAKIIQKIGTTNLLSAINKYNEMKIKNNKESLEKYRIDRKSITPETHRIFVETISLINNFYKTNKYANQDEEIAIQKFMQSDTVSEQLEAAKTVIKLLDEKTYDKSITPVKAVKNALKTATTDKVIEAEKVEKTIPDLEYVNEGRTKDD